MANASPDHRNRTNNRLREAKDHQASFGPLQSLSQGPTRTWVRGGHREDESSQLDRWDASCPSCGQGAIVLLTRRKNENLRLVKLVKIITAVIEHLGFARTAHPYSISCPCEEAGGAQGGRASWSLSGRPRGNRLPVLACTRILTQRKER